MLYVGASKSLRRWLSRRIYQNGFQLCVYKGGYFCKLQVKIMTQSSVVALTFFFIVTVCFTSEPQRDLPRFIGFTLHASLVVQLHTPPWKQSFDQQHAFFPSPSHFPPQCLLLAAAGARPVCSDSTPLRSAWQKFHSTALEQPNFLWVQCVKFLSFVISLGGKKPSSFFKMTFSLFELVED